MFFFMTLLLQMIPKNVFLYDSSASDDSKKCRSSTFKAKEREEEEDDCRKPYASQLMIVVIKVRKIATIKNHLHVRSQYLTEKFVLGWLIEKLITNITNSKL
jgi:hypothetical protein